MSQIRTAIRLAAGVGQYDPLATSPASHDAHTFVPLTLAGDAVRVSTAGVAPAAAVVIRAAAVLTNAYVGSTTVDMASAESVVVRALVTVTNAETISMKPQWSIDDSAWSDESVLTNATISGTEIQYGPSSRVIQIDASAANSYIERFNRLARYFRIAVKSNGTTARLSLTSQLL